MVTEMREIAQVLKAEMSTYVGFKTGV